MMCHLRRAGNSIASMLRRCALMLCPLGILWGLQPAQAATDLAQAPLNFLISSQSKPNLYFILDDSGSMNMSYMGDEVISYGYEKTVGYRSSRCNKIYYNPAVNYPVPVSADGSPYPLQSFTAARYDGFNAQSVAVNLSVSFTAWRTTATKLPVPANTDTATYRVDCATSAASCVASGSNDYPNLAEPAYYFLYRGSYPDKLGDNSALDACRDPAGSPNWTKVIVSSSSGPNGTDERTNFANWYSYHRTRILTMKTALGRAFRDLDLQFRVGFSTIGESGVSADLAGFLKIADFDVAQKQKFYTKLYSVDPAASTPLRAALSKAGRLYAGKLLSDADDPIRYSCQQNYTILSTDGYWNTSGETGRYGPLQIDGQTYVGDQDRTLARPMNDGTADGNPDAGTLRAAKLVLTPLLNSTAGNMILDSIKVNDVEVLASWGGLYTTRDLQADTSRFGFEMEARVGRQGYRAVAQGTVVYLIAPATANPTQAPVVQVRGAISVAAEPFVQVRRDTRLANTLADVAAYYFQTDLRQPALANCGTGRDVCTNNVPVPPGAPGGSHQHMVTHTVGLGAAGSLRYQEDYAEAATGDFRDIVDGRRGWPDPMFSNGPERIDDLWHAAVNGGGRYFSATSPESLAKALSATMANVRAASGAAAAAAASNQEPAEGDNLLFATRYRSIYWDGEVEARRINLSNGSVSATLEWSAAKQLDARVSASADTRLIWMQATSDARTLKRFEWDKLDASERNYFSQACSAQPLLSQCANLTDAERSLLTGERLLNYLRGQRGFEDRLDSSVRLFRRRDHVLGAPASAQPVYVGRPAFRYADDNYGGYRDEQQINRKGMVYVAANDGMLHAFDAATGAEDWAFVPAGVLPDLRRFADLKFGQQFSYLLDGTPVAADICPGAAPVACTASSWRTILVGGLGAAGREFYALDITDPAHPSALWRFNAGMDADLGYALGRPLITKRADGRWIALLTSGYNNVRPGSGKGFLFVLDAYTGELLNKIDTGAGSTSEPSGLAQINGWVESMLDNTTTRIYGADLLGNVWRFDIDDLFPPAGRDAVLLAQLIRDNKAQAVTTRPELSELRIGTQRIPIVSIGTGSYLGLSDASDKSVQSIYSFKDELLATGHGDVRSVLVRQTLAATDDGNSRTVTAHALDWTSTEKAGWYMDLVVGEASGNANGERVTLDPDQQLGVLRFVTNVPDSTACRPGASSWLYEFDYLTGSYLPLAKNGVLARKISGSTLSAGARTLKLGEQTVTLLTDEAGNLSNLQGLGAAAPTNAVRRVSWRELDEQ